MAYMRRSYGRSYGAPRRSYGAPRRSYGSPRRRTYGYRSQASRPAYGARAGFARNRLTRRFTVGGSRW